MNKKWTISSLVLTVVLILLTYWNFTHRVYDWDMPGYIGSAIINDYSHSPDSIREITYTSIKKEAPADHYKDLVGVSPLDTPRQYFANNTQSFLEQLPYFQIKIGYVWAVKALYFLGFTLPMSVVMLSLISYFISGLLIFYINKIIFPENYLLAFLVTLAIMLLPPMTYMSRVSTPDMFITQFVLLLLIGMFKRWSSWLMFVVLFLITFIRPDYLPLTLSYLGVIGLYTLVKERRIDFKLVLQAIILFAMYISIIKYYNYPGWKSLFYDSFIYRRPIISLEKDQFTWKSYFDVLYFKAIYFKKVTVSVILLIAGIFYLSKSLWVRIISLLFLGNLYIKFVFFPQSAALRFFFVYILALIIMFLYSLSKKYNGFKLKKIE